MLLVDHNTSNHFCSDFSNKIKSRAFGEAFEAWIRQKDILSMDHPPLKHPPLKRLFPFKLVQDQFEKVGSKVRLAYSFSQLSVKSTPRQDCCDPLFRTTGVRPRSTSCLFSFFVGFPGALGRSDASFRILDIGITVLQFVFETTDFLRYLIRVNGRDRKVSHA